MPSTASRFRAVVKKPPEYLGFSASTRRALQFHSGSKESERVLARLAELRRGNPVDATPEEKVRVIREDRAR